MSRTIAPTVRIAHVKGTHTQTAVKTGNDNHTERRP